MDSHFLICSSFENVWKRRELPYGGVTPPKETIFFKEKFYWVYLDRDYEYYPTYGYTIYWLELNINNWGYLFIPIVDIQCYMSLGLYKNQLVCVVNNGHTFVWSLEEIENFQFG